MWTADIRLITVIINTVIAKKNWRVEKSSIVTKNII